MRHKPAPGHRPLPLQFDSQDELERVIEQRVAERCEAETYRWRFRLLAIEAIMFAALVGVAGLVLGQPVPLVLGSAILVGLSCFVSGMIGLGLSFGGTRLWALMRRRWA